MSLTTWDVLDPTSVFTQADVSRVPETYSAPASAPGSSGSNFFEPSHELFGFGVVVALTTVCLFLATEKHGLGGSLKAHLGPANAGAEAGITGEDGK